MTTDIFPVVKQYNQELEKLLGQTRQLITLYQNQLLKEEADANRLVTLEEIGPGTATGSISLKNKIVQPVLITGFLLSTQANQPATVTVDRYQIPAQNGQSRIQIISPVQYIVGPGQTLTLSWTGQTDGLINYFAAFGKLIGSHFG